MNESVHWNIVNQKLADTDLEIKHSCLQVEALFSLIIEKKGWLIQSIHCNGLTAT